MAAFLKESLTLPKTGPRAKISRRTLHRTGKDLCFVLMPFGPKKDPSGGPKIDFDPIYENAIRPAIELAGMVPIRADGEQTGGIIHKAMYERLMLCDFAVADLTTANANVFYELGVRHAVRPATTLPIFAQNQQIPFDVNFLRALPYGLGKNNRFGKRQADVLVRDLTSRLKALRKLAKESLAVDSPIFQLVSDYKAPETAHIRTEVFRERSVFSEQIKKDLSQARTGQNSASIKKIERALGELGGVEAGVLVDLFLSYRAVGEYKRMADLYNRFPMPLQRSIPMREQFGFALNRLGKRDEALNVLNEVVHEQGPSSETCGLIGRIYKDRWEEETKKGNTDRAQGFLDMAIDSYKRGFESDWRDVYPGINAVTLLEIKGDVSARRKKAAILPVVRFAALQRMKTSDPNYWDYATMLELAVLNNDESDADQWLKKALALVPDGWMVETTGRNLGLIADARREHGINTAWINKIRTRMANAVRKVA